MSEGAALEFVTNEFKRNRIFISYRRVESDHPASRLAEDLKRQFGGERVFLDFDSISPGSDFEDAMNEGLRSCAATLVLIGPNWLDTKDMDGNRRVFLEGDWVRYEIEHSLASREIRVIPVLVNGAHMPTADQLPPSIAPLARRQAIELTTRYWSENVNRLVASLELIPGMALANRKTDGTRIKSRYPSESQIDRFDAEVPQKPLEVRTGILWASVILGTIVSIAAGFYLYQVWATNQSPQESSPIEVYADRRSNVEDAKTKGVSNRASNPSHEQEQTSANQLERQFPTAPLVQKIESSPVVGDLHGKSLESSINKSANLPKKAIPAHDLSSAQSQQGSLLASGTTKRTDLVIHDRRSAGAYVDDESIGWKVEARMVQKFGTEAHINAMSYNRIVLMTGEAPDEATKAEADRLAGDVANVRGAVNEITIGPAASIASRAKDSNLTSNIKSRFVEANKFPANHVRVHSSAGTVFLLGIVTRQEAEDAAQIAATTSGAKKVVRVFEYVSEAQAKELDKPREVLPTGR